MVALLLAIIVLALNTKEDNNENLQIQRPTRQSKIDQITDEVDDSMNSSVIDN
jgi:hypothetical protein